MNIPAKDLSPQQLYKLMTGSIIPRPIGWISSLSKEGVANLAPFSYFMGVSSDPPVLMFSAGKRDATTPKDTYRNVLQNGEFVVNIVTASLAEAMNITAAEVPSETSEFELAGVTPAPSKVVAVPRVLESPINFECKLIHTYEIGSNVAVFGEIIHLHIDDGVLLEGDKIDFLKLDPVGRLAGSSYAYIRDLFELLRPVYRDSIVKDQQAD